MKKTILPSQRDILQSIHEEIQRSENSKYAHKLQALILVIQGKSCRQVLALVGDAPRSVAYWVQRFKESGFLRPTCWITLRDVPVSFIKTNLIQSVLL
jgi:hypothetical protein